MKTFDNSFAVPILEYFKYRSREQLDLFPPGRCILTIYKPLSRTKPVGRQSFRDGLRKQPLFLNASLNHSLCVWNYGSEPIEAGKPAIEALRDEAQIGFPCKIFLDGLLPADESDGFCSPELGQREHRPQQIGQVVPRPISDLQNAGRSERRPINAALPYVISERTGPLVGGGKRHMTTVRLDTDSSPLVLTRLQNHTHD